MAWHSSRDTSCVLTPADSRSLARGESLGLSAIDRARLTGIVNARHALTPSGRICIQQRKCVALRLLAAVHRYVPLRELFPERRRRTSPRRQDFPIEVEVNMEVESRKGESNLQLPW